MNEEKSDVEDKICQESALDNLEVVEDIDATNHSFQKEETKKYESKYRFVKNETSVLITELEFEDLTSTETSQVDEGTKVESDSKLESESISETNSEAKSDVKSESKLEFDAIPDTKAEAKSETKSV